MRIPVSRGDDARENIINILVICRLAIVSIIVILNASLF